MLFMPMMAAAARAASIASGFKCSAAAVVIAFGNCGLRDVMADVSAEPQICCLERSGCCRRLLRFSFKSLA